MNAKVAVLESENLKSWTLDQLADHVRCSVSSGSVGALLAPWGLAVWVKRIEPPRRQDRQDERSRGRPGSSPPYPAHGPDGVWISDLLRRLCQDSRK
jgi:hypothetical protein